jgi:uncharacterized protein YgiM (DUF1202 family)
MNMKTLNERLADISLYLQSLNTPKFSSAIQDAVEKKDKISLIKVCKKAGIPETYRGTIVSVILSVSPEQKWPSLL